MHPRNRYNTKNAQAYEFSELVVANPQLKAFVKDNGYGKDSIDFSDPKAVKELNKALLLAHFGLLFWDIPEQFLCPPVPGRLDYLHHLADLLASDLNGQIPRGRKITGLDIGTGANLIYPIVGTHEYNWRFVGTDIEQVSVDCANQLVKANPKLRSSIKLRKQPDSQHIFNGIITENDMFAFSMCNPPFHKSAEAAQTGTARKNKNLGSKPSTLNFGGQSNELWCEGGESEFVCKMVRESSLFSTQVVWFTSLVSSNKSLPIIEQALKKEAINTYKIVEMGQGNKQSRFIAWTYLTTTERQECLQA